MDERFALRLLRDLMEWEEDVAVKEYAWVRLTSRLKYDGYRDYLAGIRFAESLAGWLSQFGTVEHRRAAYDFVKTRLIYFSPPEIQRLVDQLYPRFIEPRLREAAARESGIEPHLVWANPIAKSLFERKRRQVLVIGLSDGARLDVLRRANAGILVNDQIVLATHIDDEKWEDLGNKLREKLASASAEAPRFDSVYLVDDFTGSGTSFVRPKKASWTGKAVKFWKMLQGARERMEREGRHFPVAEGFVLHIHHYISSAQARTAIEERLKAIEADWGARGEWFSSVDVSEGLLLPETTKVTQATDAAMWELCEQYYDHALFEQLREHLEEAKQTHLRHGYGNSALPVVLEHNCPNNAITLLWAETEGESSQHAMRPLFPRRHRHS